jgi:ABC-type transport system substrate-binding protein
VRRIIIGGLAVVLVTLGLGDESLAQKVPAPRGELRIVDRSFSNWAFITFNVMDHLVELDRDGNLVPRLATSWRWLDEQTLEMKLRRGVSFHNGEAFDAEIVKLNWDENTKLKQPHASGEFLNFKPGSRLVIVDPYTVRLVFPEPDGAALAKLVYMHIANRQFYHEFGWGEKHW